MLSPMTQRVEMMRRMIPVVEAVSIALRGQGQPKKKTPGHDNRGRTVTSMVVMLDR